MSEKTNHTNALTVYYDGACPVCSREIGFYRRRRGAGDIDWVDVSQAPEGSRVATDLTRADALARFHVRGADGRLVDGGAAFAALWHALPAFRPLGRMCRWRPLAAVLEAAYAAFLKLRAWR